MKTLDDLIMQGLAGEGLGALDVVELDRDEETGTATYRLPSALARRDLVVTVTPPTAAVYETPVAVEAAMREAVPDDFDASAVRAALRAWYPEITSNAAADRRVYRVVAELLGLA